MKALTCKAFGPIDSLTLADVPTPEPAPGEVLIAVAACSVNFPDALIVQGKYQFKPAFPFSPGGDVAGIVTAVGEGVETPRPGDRVMALTGWGGMAEAVIVPARACVPLPAGVDFVAAAAIPMVYGTSYHALHDRGRLQAGETLLVLGAAGGVGLAAVQIGKALGATVIAAASGPEKLAVAKEQGADHLIDYAKEDMRDRLKAITGGKGVDVVFDPVGGGFSEPAFRSLGWDGRHLVVGFAGGTIPALPLNLALLKAASLVGVFFGQFTKREPERAAANFRMLLEWLEAGRIRPVVSETFSLAEGASAIAALAERRAVGKLVVKVR